MRGKVNFKITLASVLTMKYFHLQSNILFNFYTEQNERARNHFVIKYKQNMNNLKNIFFKDV